MEITQQSNREDRDVIRQKLIDYNRAKLPDEMIQPGRVMTYVLRNEHDEVVGGITGTNDLVQAVY